MCIRPGMATDLLHLACTTCNADLQAGIFDGRFPLHVLALAAPFAALTPIVWWLFRRG